ncbi:MAG: DUF6588 family protein [Bdellovibrionia bacterium]
MKKSLLSLTLLLSLSTAHADPTFTNITSDDFEDISMDMSANFTHNSMLGASKMGTVFGVQAGLALASTSTKRTNDIVKRNADADMPNLYNAGLMAAVGIPFGIAFEAILFPETELGGAKLSSTSLGLKYNLNEVIPILPVNLALRGIYSTSKMSFEQTVSSVTNKIENSNTVSGLQLLFSPMLPVVEPYVGIGLLSGNNKLSVSGTGTIFDSSFSTSQSESKNVSTTQILAGVDVSLLLLKIGVEYSNAFGTDRYGLKLSLGF